jgi:hypothetical protein
MKKTLLAAVAVSLMTVGGAFATTLNGTFSVSAVNITNVNGTESQATEAAMNAAAGMAGAATDTFTYTGDINFETTTSSDSTTVLQWFDSIIAGGVSGIDPVFGGLKLSKDDINGPNGGTATTTFLKFTLTSSQLLTAGNFSGSHDDGLTLFSDGVIFGSNVGPTGKVPFSYESLSTGVFSFLYVATNGNPSVLNINTTASPVPLPASAWMLLAGVGGIAAMRRRKKAA